MRICWSLVLTASLMACLTGCQSLGLPNWGNPGPASYQQTEAHRFDPYPDNETGPEILGGRPRGFTNPPAEPTRARWDPRRWFAAG